MGLFSNLKNLFKKEKEENVTEEEKEIIEEIKRRSKSL